MAASAVLAPSEPVGRPRPLLGLAVLPTAMAVIALAAFLLRLRPVLEGGGLRGNGDYDDGVYFASAIEILHGQVPYRDFVLLHPPGVPYLLVPFAALGNVIGDANAFAVARVAFMLIGAGTAALAVWVGSRHSLAIGLASGAVYAVWAPAVHVEYTTLMEVPSNLVLMLALGLLGVPVSRAVTRRAAAVPYLAGALLGAGATFKIWGVVPLLVVVAWQLAAAGPVRAARVAVGAVATVVLVCLPTLALAGPAMLRMVVEAQLGRQGGPATGTRLRMLSSLHLVLAGPAGRSTLALSAAVALAALACAVALATPRAAVYVLLLIANVAVLLQSPTYFSHYGDFTAVPIALVLGVAIGRAIDVTRWPRTVLAVPAVAILAALIAVQVGGDWSLREDHPFPAAAVDRLAANSPCVVSDTPTALILANLITRDLNRGCLVRVDVSGVTYASERVTAHGKPVSRVKNPLWQKDIRAYLTSAPTVVRARHGGDDLSAATKADLHRRLSREFHVPGVTVDGLRHRLVR